jgi:GTP-binding protein
MSAVTGEGVSQVVGRLAQLVDEGRKAEPDSDGFVILRPEPDGVWVERLDDGAFRVHGRAAERAVALNDVTTAQALDYIDHRLKRLGVTKALARAGVADGDVVWIGDFSFEYEADR